MCCLECDHTLIKPLLSCKSCCSDLVGCTFIASDLCDRISYRQCTGPVFTRQAKLGQARQELRIVGITAECVDRDIFSVGEIAPALQEAHIAQHDGWCLPRRLQRICILSISELVFAATLVSSSEEQEKFDRLRLII